MSSNLLIRGGRIFDPGQGIDFIGDILINKGIIAKLEKTDNSAQKKDISIIDATGLIVCPGFIDLHCHLREPGFEDKETIATGTRAAAKGGFTTICCMPKQIGAESWIKKGSLFSRTFRPRCHFTLSLVLRSSERRS